MLSGLGASASEPDGEASWVVVAAVGFVGEFTLAVDGAAEFSAPDDEGVVEEASLFEV